MTELTCNTEPKLASLDLNYIVTHFVQRKEWTWDENKMTIMQDPIYR